MDQLFNQDVSTAVENAVIRVFECDRCEILQYKDTDMKKLVVFILFQFYKYDWHFVGKAYQMTYLYVPTVADDGYYRYNTDDVFREKVDLVLEIVRLLKIAV